MHGGASVDPILKVAAQDVTCDLDLSYDEVTHLLDLADQVKAEPANYAVALLSLIHI